MSIFNTTRSNLLHYTKTRNLEKLKSVMNSSDIDFNSVADDCGNNLLHLSVFNNDYFMTEYLLSRGVDYNKKNMFEHTPWDLAIMLRNNSVINKFISYKSDGKILEHFKTLKDNNERL